MRLILLLFVLLSAASVSAQPLIVSSFNLRYDNPRDSGNLWKDRAPVCASLIRFHQFDIFGTQEGLRHQLDTLNALLPEYTYAGVGRDDGKAGGEHSAIFYRKDRFERLDGGDFWLSTTPEKPGKSWDAALPRICTWLKLRDRQSRRNFYIFNAHYDHIGVQARIESSKLILTRLQAVAGKDPVIVMGDLNGSHSSPWYKTFQESGLVQDVIGLSPVVYRNNGSFSAFKTTGISADVIDHIFVTEGVRVSRYGILTDTYYGKFPSDHFPVMAELRFK
jgi:endonuclease/exonuclease/phosphatase family metal-dependent hydrolase